MTAGDNGRRLGEVFVLLVKNDMRETINVFVGETRAAAWTALAQYMTFNNTKVLELARDEHQGADDSVVALAALKDLGFSGSCFSVPLHPANNIQAMAAAVDKERL